MRCNEMAKRLVWQNDFDRFVLNAIEVPADGNCFYHSFLMGFYMPYILCFKDGAKVDRLQIVLELREAISNKLEAPVDPLDVNGSKYYDILSRGTLGEFALSSQSKEFTLEGLKESLRRGAIGQEAIELTSIVCKKNIYILNAITKDVYYLGDSVPLLHRPDRSCVVLLYYPEGEDYIGHYELIALGRKELRTHLAYDDPFIVFLRERLQARTRGSSLQ